METFFQDVRHALRMFRQSPSFTLTALAALAFGIGANIAIFSVVNAVLLRPVDLPDADRVVLFMNTFGQGGSGANASPAKFAHWRQQTDVVEDVSAIRTNVMNYTGGDLPRQVHAAQVSADYFRLFRAPLALGRFFAADEDRPDGPKVAVISHAFWSQRFASDPNIVGKTISLSDDAYTVVGVIAPGFDVSEIQSQVPDVWVPFQLDPNSADQGHYFTVAGRVKAGVTIEQAQARIGASAAAFGEKFPNVLQPKDGFTVERVQDVLVRDVRSTLLLLAGAVLLVLLIACANVANLLLARAAGRRREIAIRAALGAGRRRIIRQLLTESVLLALAGGALGLGLGVVAMKALLGINTAGLPRVGEGGASVGVDWRVAAFTVLVSLLTGVVFGLAPALQGSRSDLADAMKEGGRGASGGRGVKARSILVVCEVALALVLLIGSSLLIRTTMALRAVDPGYDTENVLTMRMSLAGTRFLTSAAVDRLIKDGVDRVRAIPGVEQASATCCVPLEGGYGLPFKVVGRPLTDGPFHGGGGWLTVSPGYFEVFKIPVQRGRSFTDADTAAAPGVVVVNAAFVREFFKEGDPIGARLVIGRGVMKEFDGEPEREIIGIVGDVRDGGLNADPNPTMYIPQAQVPDAVNALNVRITPIAWVVRTKIAPTALAGTVQEQLRAATGLPLAEVRAMSEVVSRSTSRERFNMLVMTIFGAAALLLAAIGIYGLMTYSVEQRTREIGIRMALGAEPSRVRRMIVLQGMRLVLVGAVLGVGAALALARLLASFVFGVEVWDPLVFTVVPVVLALVAFVALWLPALRASRVDPLAATRAD
jgi:predicted permease